MTRAGLFPAWIAGALAGDAVFARAYAAVSDPERALIKTALARSWEGSGPSEALSRRTDTVLRSGLRAVGASTPRPALALVFDSSEVSPARLLAALVPALAAGVSEVLAVRLGGRGHPPAPLLVALELAGVERLALLPREQGPRLCEHLAAHPACLVLALGSAPVPAAWRGRLERPLGLWLDRPGDLDLQAVAFAQADAALEAWGPGARGLAAPFVRRSGTFESFLRQGYAALYAPTARHEACLGRAPLVLGSGCESCWLWPDLAADLFFTHSTAWSLDGQGGR
jgi:hypothetical protein